MTITRSVSRKMYGFSRLLNRHSIPTQVDVMRYVDAIGAQLLAWGLEIPGEDDQ